MTTAAAALLFLIGLLAPVNLSATLPGVPPPPALDAIVNASTVIVTATGIELLYLSCCDEGRTVASKEPKIGVTGGHSGGFALRARVDEVLYCQSPCPNQTEILIGLGLNSSQRPHVRDLFLNKRQIFLLVDRPFSMELMPKEFSGKWYATNEPTIGFFQPLEERSRVLQLIKQRK